MNNTIKRLVAKMNKYIKNNHRIFNNNFIFKIMINIEDKHVFNNGCCAAITADNKQCSRKVKKNNQFCGLHRCDEHAHRRKKNKPHNFISSANNFTSYKYIIDLDIFTPSPEYSNLVKIYSNNSEFLFNNTTNILYKEFNNIIYELGDIYQFNLIFD